MANIKTEAKLDHLYTRPKGYFLLTGNYFFKFACKLTRDEILHTMSISTVLHKDLTDYNSPDLQLLSRLVPGGHNCTLMFCRILGTIIECEKMEGQYHIYIQKKVYIQLYFGKGHT